MLRKICSLAIFGLLLVEVLSPSHVAATSIAPIKLEDLFRGSPVVATVHFLSADAEFYPEGVCKTQVKTSYKGTEKNAILYISPCLTYEVGVDYILFLSYERDGNVHHQNSASPYPAMKSAFDVADAGYGRMLIEYSCVFEGGLADQACDYGVKLNPEQVILPTSLTAFPKCDATAETNYYRWVRKSEMETYLDLLVAAPRGGK